MDDELDALLRGNALAPPDDFTLRVMQSVYRLPAPAPRPERWRGLARRLQAAALIIGGMAGAAQLAAFMFGIWATTTAG